MVYRRQLWVGLPDTAVQESRTGKSGYKEFGM